MFNDILLPIDLNHPESWIKALPMALKLRAEGGTLHLLGVVHEIAASMVATYLPDDFESQAVEAMKADLRAWAAREIPGDTGVEVHVAHGHVAEEIVGTAEELGVELIVMASHPPSELRTLFIGSQADRVVNHAHTPVLVVR